MTRLGLEVSIRRFRCQCIEDFSFLRGNRETGSVTPVGPPHKIATSPFPFVRQGPQELLHFSIPTPVPLASKLPQWQPNALSASVRNHLLSLLPSLFNTPASQTRFLTFSLIKVSSPATALAAK